MAGITLPVLRPMVRNRISAVVADSYLTSDVIDGYINEAVQQVVSEEDWPWLAQTSNFSSVIGQTRYPLATVAGIDWYRVHSIFDTITGSQLDMRTVQEIDRINYPLGGTTGPSAQFAIFGDELVLAPAPNDTRSLLLHWFKREPALIGDLDQLLMPGNANFHVGVVEYAAYLALRQVREDARSESAYTAYTRWLARVRDEKLRSHSGSRVRVRAGSMI